MSTTLALSLLILGVVIILALAWYALVLQKEVKRREAFRHEEERMARENGLENLELVAAALLQGQVDITEGAWRCKVLLELLDPSLPYRQEFRIFADVYEQTRHLHTHQARKDLTPKARFEEDKQRIAVEDSSRDEVLKAAQSVLDFRANYPESLN